MEKKNTMTFTLSIVTIIVGVALYKQFDFQEFKFEKPALSVIYAIVFVISISILIKNAKKK